VSKPESYASVWDAVADTPSRLRISEHGPN
jgi:predicted XRE-type DNA-binding protein